MAKEFQYSDRESQWCELYSAVKEQVELAERAQNLSPEEIEEMGLKHPREFEKELKRLAPVPPIIMNTLREYGGLYKKIEDGGRATGAGEFVEE